MYRSILLFFIASVLLMVHAHELYSDKYDNVDVDAIITDDKLRISYYNCFMDRGPCTEDAEYFKGNMPEAIATQCIKCTEWQKTAFDKIAAWYAENDEPAWNEFVDKYIELAKQLNITPVE
ncbi:hypothetical protein PV327_003633 [Microctonus hyperodae]|uniref:Uncharacterized protein n=1 Tax=Microctonus hyperodae TaxID=165561 RepID=A0AA39G4W4_MICHY|nr:hypothetical protein PV327_003633 [Microctonus hyperodae]